MNTKEVAVVIAAIMFIALIISGPLITIWAVNTLFPVAAIPYTIETYFASLVLAGVFGQVKIKYGKSE